MNGKQYVQENDVKKFIDWINTKNEPGSFLHSYTSLKPKQDWQCNSVYNAYENYNWAFSFTDPTGKQIKCNDFDESTAYLIEAKNNLMNAILINDQALTEKNCDAILGWGGVSKDRDKNIETLKTAQKTLTPLTFDTDHEIKGIFMNSGYSKIYSCLIDDFIIYDSRVGAALGLLVRKFCEETKIKSIPNNLHFAFADARLAKGHIGKIRDPGNDVYKFSKLNNNASFYIHNNMKANWLVKEVTDHPDSKFSRLKAEKRMRAFESALFMIGYKVNQDTN